MVIKFYPKTHAVYNYLKIQIETVMNEFDSDAKALLSEVRQDIKTLSREIGSLTTSMTNFERTHQDTSDRINRLEDHVKFTEGALSSIKMIGSVATGGLLTAFITFATWVTVSIQDHKMSVERLHNSIEMVKADQRSLRDSSKVKVTLLADNSGDDK